MMFYVASFVLGEKKGKNVGAKEKIEKRENEKMKNEICFII